MLHLENCASHIRLCKKVVLFFPRPHADDGVQLWISVLRLLADVCGDSFPRWIVCRRLLFRDIRMGVRAHREGQVGSGR